MLGTKKLFFTALLSVSSLFAEPLTVQNPSPFFLTTIPKSGTHLALKTINLVTEYTPVVPVYEFAELGWNCFLSDFQIDRLDHGRFEEMMLKTFRNKACVFSHMNFWPVFTEFRQAHPEFKPLICIRDLRDVLVSNVNFQWNELEAYLGPSTFEQKLVFLLTTTMPLYEIGVLDIRRHTEMAIEALKDSDIFIVKFEDLVGPRGGGNKEKQLETIAALLNQISISLDEQQLLDIADILFGDGVKNWNYSTFRSGRIGSWKKYFTKSSMLIFKQYWSDYQKSLGYNVEE